MKRHLEYSDCSIYDLIKQKAAETADLCALSYFGRKISYRRLIAETDKGLKCVYNGTVIGSKKIVRFKNQIKATAFYLLITQSRSNPYIRSIEIFE